MNKPKKARVAEVSLGQIKFEGLMLPDGTYAISLQQLRALAFPSVHIKNAQNELKSFIGKDFEFIKAVTELNNRPQIIIKLELITFCLVELAFKGHQEARDLVRLLAGLSLTELFNDAFGISSTPQTRQQYIEEKSLLRLREELTIAHGGFQAKCINLKYCARHVHDYATKQLVGRTATESINQVPINPEFIEYEKYSKEFIGINHVNDDEVKFLERLINFKRYFSSKKPRINENWKEYTDRVLTFI